MDPPSDIGGIKSGAYQLIAHMALSPKKVVNLHYPEWAAQFSSAEFDSRELHFLLHLHIPLFEESSRNALQLTSILSPYGRSQFSIITGHPGEVVSAKAPLFQLISPLWSGTSKVVLINTYLVPS